MQFLCRFDYVDLTSASKEAGSREGNESDGARSPPIVSGALVFGAALGTALAATLFLRK